MTSFLRLAPLALLLAAAVPGAGEQPPARDELARQAERCRRLLKTSLVDFYLPACVDSVNGGYLETWRDGKFVPTGEKFLVLQARQLWFFSTLAAERIERDKALAAAKTGFDFLEGKMRDRKNGGYFSKVTDDGRPKDRRKHAYLHAFALYGLTAYVRSAGSAPDAHKAMEEAFYVIEGRMRDQQHGGYTEFFTEEWRPITDPKEPNYVGASGTKTYNTHLHLLEAFTPLYRTGGFRTSPMDFDWQDLLTKRLEELLTINTNTVRHPDYFCNIDGWRPDWHVIQEPRNLRASYGHDVECAWLALDAARALGQPPAVLRNWAEALAGYSLKYGYDRQHGGFFYTGPLGQPADDTRKEWWVQAEALVGMLELYRLTGKREYYDVFAQTLDFVEWHQIAKNGGWYATRTADGGPLNDERSSPWQEAYHGGRALLLSAKILEELAKGPGTK